MIGNFRHLGFLYATCTSPIMHLICSPKFGTTGPLFFISPGYYSRPKRNWKQCLCKVWGASEVHCGKYASGEFRQKSDNGTRLFKVNFKKNVLKLYNLFWRQRLSKNLGQHKLFLMKMSLTKRLQAENTQIVHGYFLLKKRWDHGDQLQRNRGSAWKGGFHEGVPAPHVPVEIKR